MKHTIVLAYLLCVLSSCDNQSPSPEGAELADKEYLIFGHYYGFCVGEGCIEIFKLTKSNLYEDTNDHYPSSNKSYQGEFIKLDESRFNKLKDLNFEVPSELLNETKPVIGAPDAADGGGIYLELPDGSYWLIDMNENYLPEYLHPLRENIRTAISLINE